MLWILSYPRSGNHLLRTYIEYLTCQETLGCIHNEKVDQPIYKRKKLKNNFLKNRIQSTHAIARKAHKCEDVKENSKSFDSLILLIRSPYECILSHLSGICKECHNVKQEIKLFENNITYFKSFRGHKTILFYENMIQNPKECIKKLGTFLRLDNVHIQECIAQQSEIFNIALNATERPPVSYHDVQYYQKKEKIEYTPKNSYIQSILKRYIETS